jgi:cytidyltransferase-like protein
MAMKEIKTVGIVTGGFDPVHSGHIHYLNHANLLCDWLVVGINSDAWLQRKKSREFMPYNERKTIIEHLNMVDEIIEFDDSDDTAIDCIKKVLEKYSKCRIVFCNGGDRTKENIPEMVFSDDVIFEFGVGGTNKANSSSWILKNWDKPTTERLWGKYRELDHNGHWKVKELSIDVGKSLSDQRHFVRSEHWHIVDGDLRMNLEFPNGYETKKIYKTGDSIDIPKRTWHKAINVGNKPVKVIEVWMGDVLSEDDIERRV